MSEDQYICRNISEDLIDAYLDKTIASTNMCQCPRCRIDVRALALNQFPPRYVVSDIGDLLVRVEGMAYQSQADIITAIVNAIKVIREHPRHAPPAE